MWGLSIKKLEDNARLDEDVLRIIANALLWGRGSYDTPEEWAAGILKRLSNEGYEVKRK